MGNANIMLVDDHKLIRDALRSYLEKNKEYHIVAEASNGIEALDHMAKEAIDLVVMDMNMDKMDGLECTEKILEIYPNCKVLVLTMLNETLHIKRMLKAGASGYVLKSAQQEEVLKAIEMVLSGGNYYSSEVTSTVMSNISGGKKSKSSMFEVDPGITKREKEVLKLICKEYTNQEIADELFISLRTVDAHKRNLLEKTGAKNVAGLVLYTINKNMFEDL